MFLLSGTRRQMSSIFSYWFTFQNQTHLNQYESVQEFNSYDLYSRLLI